MFVPAIMEPVPTAVATMQTADGDHKRRGCKAESRSGLIEMDIGGITIRIGRGVDAETVAAMIAALKAAS
jgi:transposase